MNSQNYLEIFHHSQLNYKHQLPRSSLLIIYKPFIRSFVDCGDIIYDQPYNATFHQRIESVHYNAAMTINGAFRSSSREKPYQELDSELFTRYTISKNFVAF